MRKQIVFTILALICLGIIGMVDGGNEAEAKVNVSADSAILMDVQSGVILYEKNMDKKEYPASITKIMTALVAIENSSLSETVTYSKEAVTNLESGASNIEIQPGEKLSMEDSLYGILMMSANEACNGVAEHIAGSVEEFVKMMNEKAKELGCTGTHFANANGLYKKNHYTTAHDMGIIARAAFRNPTFAKITGTKTYTIPRSNKHLARPIYNHHGMLYPYKFPQYVYEYCVGGKTGYTEKCRYTLVTYAKKNGMTLLSVVMRVPKSPYEEPNEYTDSTQLLNYGFRAYKKVKIGEDAAEEISTTHLFSGFSPFFSKEASPLTIDSDAGVILPKKASLSDTEKKIEYYESARDCTEGKNLQKKIIGHITYTYKGSEVGGSDIYYDSGAAGSAVELADSMDMSEWFDDAREEAEKEPFPWKTFFIVTGSILVAAGLTVFFIWRICTIDRIRKRTRRYRRERQNTGTGSSLYYRKKWKK